VDLDRGFVALSRVKKLLDRGFVTLSRAFVPLPRDGGELDRDGGELDRLFTAPCIAAGLDPVGAAPPSRAVAVIPPRSKRKF
jgi:hypothetical protein